MSTVKEVLAMDNFEMTRGYMDGFRGNQADSMNESYQHGWNNGIADRAGEPDKEQRELARDFIVSGCLVT